MLELRHVTKVFRAPAGDVRALDDVSLRVEAGEFVAVQGPSGCGKSTLLAVAGGMLAPTSGGVTVDGVDPYALTPDARARWRAERIGFVFQRFHLVPYLSVTDNVLVPDLAARRPGARQRAAMLVSRFALDDRRAHRPAELSTGERQRVALARALLNEPKVVLADEPTGNLDPDSARVVLDHLAEFARAGGAVLLVTHDAGAAHRAGRSIRLGSAPAERTEPPENGGVVSS